MLGTQIYKILVSQVVSVALLWLFTKLAYSAKERQNFPDYPLKFVSYIFQFPCVCVILKDKPKQNICNLKLLKNLF